MNGATTIQERLKDLRLNKGLKLEELAEQKTIKENRCCMVCWLPCSSGLCCGYSVDIV